MTIRCTLLCLFICILFCTGCVIEDKSSPDDYVSFKADLTTGALRMYWKNEAGQPFKSLDNLKQWIAGNGLKLVFAMNGGMYQKDNRPLGLYIENGKLIVPLDTSSGTGNFYLKPNGVFYLTSNNTAGVCSAQAFPYKTNIQYATQSGPMLVIDGKIHSSFTKGSKNVFIRNGVGILPDGMVLFAMSKKEVNLYDFARFFLLAGCQNALYLDGFVSRTYLPAKQWVQLDGDFGVIIGMTEQP